MSTVNENHDTANVSFAASPEAKEPVKPVTVRVRRHRASEKSKKEKEQQRQARKVETDRRAYEPPGECPQTDKMTELMARQRDEERQALFAVMNGKAPPSTMKKKKKPKQPKEKKPKATNLFRDDDRKSKKIATTEDLAGSGEEDNDKDENAKPFTGKGRKLGGRTPGRSRLVPKESGDPSDDDDEGPDGDNDSSDSEQSSSEEDRSSDSDYSDDDSSSSSDDE